MQGWMSIRHCWREHQVISTENEEHVLFDCPLYAAERNDLRSELHSLTVQRLDVAAHGEAKMTILFTSILESDWEALSRFLARVRQRRRRFKAMCEQLVQRLRQKGYSTRLAEWRSAGKWACRHGVFFAPPQLNMCHCMQRGSVDTSAWSRARYMAHIDEDLHMITVAPFNIGSFRRIGELRSQLRSEGWC